MCNLLVLTGALMTASAAAATHPPSELIGTWRGSSSCVDRAAAPACRDEVVIYEFSAGAKPGTVHWIADKVVGSQRQRMGDIDLSFDVGANCWAAEFRSPRLRSTWCLVVEGDQLVGTGRLLPSRKIVRRIDARKS